MIPRFKPRLGRKEFKAAFSFFSKNDVQRFEEDFAALMGQKYAIAFPYGRTGTVYLLKALGLKNREIICPAYTCVVVPHAVVYSGNVPVFVDCAPNEFNMDLDKVEAAITDKTGAIIATSIFGYPVDLDKLSRIKKKYPHVHIIQDCAHSFAAEWKGRAVQKEGCAAVFGLNISKLLTSVFGGMITTDDPGLYAEMQRLWHRDQKCASWTKSMKRLLYFLTVFPTFWGPVYGIINRLERAGLLQRFVKYYDPFRIDMPDDYLEQMTQLEARVGRANIASYGKIIGDRRRIVDGYFEMQNSVEIGDVYPPRVNGATYSHFVVQVKNRGEWGRWGIKHGIQFGFLIDYCIPEMPAYGNHSSHEFPISSAYAKGCVNIPIWRDCKQYIQEKQRGVMRQTAQMLESCPMGEMRFAQADDIGKITALHLQSLPRDLLPRLGRKILSRYYSEFICENRVAVYCIDNEIIGFLALGTNAISPSVILEGSYLIAIGRIVFQPSVWGQVIWHIIGAKAPDELPEISFIAVDYGHRSCGIGSQLISWICQHLAHRGFEQIKVKTETKNKRSNRFYQRNGFNFNAIERRYGRHFNVYTRCVFVDNAPPDL